MDSLTSPTMLVPNHSPTIVAEYSASLTSATFGEHDVESPQATSTPNKDKRVIFISLLNIEALTLLIMF
jgi:hypothetical protein